MMPSERPAIGMRRGGRDRCGITHLILTHEAAVDVHLGMPNQRDSFWIVSARTNPSPSEGRS